MLAIFSTALRWLIGFAQIKAVFASILTLVTMFLINIVKNALTPYMNLSALNSAFSAIPPAVWYFVDMANLTFAFTTIITAYTVRFLIRRIPFIG